MTMTRLEDYESYNGKYIVQLTKDPQRSPESKKYKTFDQAKRADFDKGDGWQNMADAARETLGCLTCLFGFLFTLAVYALAAYGAYCFFVR